MTLWTSAELTTFADQDELHIAAERTDGTLREPRIVWMVRVGDEVYVRSAHGLDGAWYRAVLRTGKGHVSVAGLERDVLYQHAPGHFDAEIDAAFWAKYGRYPAQYVEPVTNDASHETTIRIVPR
ncbi:MAG: DUF2255 family protein [Thermomicrobiales bacterium]|nr:DUF2255 family protein [Thermomicrobiales bacterium]MCO5219161.1 DUF2255 family protein [Thermomicrobiales bacterium]MCO5225849.1 DUF2255 family protein [Thermomicrobiales bacterium]MCO5228081.1 DUF2255 family protein [Thermomicrobiales bacterium]